MAQLNILISDRGTSEQKLDSMPANGGIAANSNSNSTIGSGATNILKIASVHQLMTNTISMAKNIVQDSISMHGDLTGDYMGQTKMENTYKIISGVASFGTGLAAGAMVGGVPGFVVAAVVQTGNLVYQQVKSNFMYSNSIVKSNIAANFNSQRIGNILIGGGRQ